MDHKQHLQRYLETGRALIDKAYEVCDFVTGSESADAQGDTWKAFHDALYEDVLPAHYNESYAEPYYAASVFGAESGRVLAALLYEVRAMIPFAYEGEREAIDIRKDLFEKFALLAQDAKDIPEAEDVIYLLKSYYVSHTDEERRKHFYKQVAEEEGFFVRLLQTADLEDTDYLYRYGEPVSDNEKKMAEHLNRVSEDKIDRMAQTFVRGYCDGFAATNRDLSIKETVRIYYDLGFERVVKRAMELFAEKGLRTMITRAYCGAFYAPNDMPTSGVMGSRALEQYHYDHKDDNALFMNASYQEMRLDAYRKAGEAYKKQARLYGGPAVIETFGREPFVPEQKEAAVRLNKEQQQLVADFRVKSGLMMNEYIPGDERSFTIIAFPVPEIGDDFSEIFDEVIHINTLDVELYRDVQQKLIDVLDAGTYCIVRGMGDNRTDMKVMIRKPADPAHESAFENCVADVNIPVGEVFTSPVLKGTEGTLHVTGVYLDGLYYEDLSFAFEDGVVTDYACGNFETTEEGRRYIEENILFHHKTLPIGEFAIGTNTVAYVVARKYRIEQKLPILIAEKTGPHFALGDTCYSYEEDVETFNPDGKKLIAKENEISCRRIEDPEKAYFSCHTDITLPYDELGYLGVVRDDGSETPIIENGRFVLPGTEPLNEALTVG